MQSFEEIQKYSAAVCAQVRWKKAKPVIATEIESHLCDQRDAYMADGDSEETATEKAILQMGDAVFIGRQLNQTHKPKPQRAMLALTWILMLSGMYMNYLIDTSGFSLNSFHMAPWLIAFLIFTGCYYLDFTLLGKYALPIFAAAILLSAAGICTGTTLNGRLYFLFSNGSFSLADLSLLFPFVYALFVYAMKGKGFIGILLCEIALVPIAVILAAVPTTAGMILFLITALIVLCYSAAKGWFGIAKKQGTALILIPAFFMFLIFAASYAPYAIRRFSGFFNDGSESGYIYYIIRRFLSESVLFGKGGIPQGLPELSKCLPNVGADYSLVYLFHEYGTAVIIGLAALLSLFSFMGFYKASRQKNVLGSLAAVSITCSFLLQSLLFLAESLGYGLVSSISLPFISYGSSELFLNAALTGFMLSAFRTGDLYHDTFKDDFIRKPIFSYQDGKLIIDMNNMQNKMSRS